MEREENKLCVCMGRGKIACLQVILHHLAFVGQGSSAQERDAMSSCPQAHAGDCQLGRGISGAPRVPKAWEGVCESPSSPLRQQILFTIVQLG